MNKELVNRLIKDMSKAEEPSEGFMYRFELDCGTPSCLVGHIESYYYDEIIRIRKCRFYDNDEFISEKLEVPEEGVFSIAYPTFVFANYNCKDPSKEGYITKPMLIKFLKNLLKEDDPEACWWLASEGVVL